MFVAEGFEIVKNGNKPKVQQLDKKMNLSSKYWQGNIIKVKY